jgi:hypothetical protein
VETPTSTYASPSLGTTRPVEKCEVVLLRKVLDLVDDPRESSIAGTPTAEIIEETREPRWKRS